MGAPRPEDPGPASGPAMVDGTVPGDGRMQSSPGPAARLPQRPFLPELPPKERTISFGSRHKTIANYSRGNSYISFKDIWEFIGEDEDATPEMAARLPHRGSVQSDDLSVPCEQVKVSGGTAPFFTVNLRQGRGNCSGIVRFDKPGDPRDRADTTPVDMRSDLSGLVGKDVGHAKGEVDFYRSLQREIDTDPRWKAFGQFTLECMGVAALPCRKNGALEERALLVLENMRQSEDTRMLDVKIGAETAVAHWKGKSVIGAWKNSWVDGHTNSAREGYRLESIDLPGAALRQRINVVVGGSMDTADKAFMSARAMERMFCQRLSGRDIVGAFVDMREVGPGLEYQSRTMLLKSIRALQLLIHSMADIPVPQKWIGSSLSLCTSVEQTLEERPVQCGVFDWGRSELTSAVEFEQLSGEEKADRLRYWRQYNKALCRFQWEMCRMYAHRCCCPTWAALVFELQTEQVKSIFRTAFFGDMRSDIAVSREPLLLKDLQGGTMVSVPLVRDARGGGIAEACGTLSITVSGEGAERLASGEGLITVHVRRAADVPLGIAHEGLAVTVRVVAFEFEEDALRHVDGFCKGHAESVPQGRAFEQQTNSGTFSTEGLSWEDIVEFEGLGQSGAKDSHDKFVEGLQNPDPHCRSFSYSAWTFKSHPLFPILSGNQVMQDVDSHISHMSSFSSGHVSPWEEVFPPTIGTDEEHGESCAASFSACIIPWLPEDALVPRRWRANSSRATNTRSGSCRSLSSRATCGDSSPASSRHRMPRARSVGRRKASDESSGLLPY